MEHLPPAGWSDLARRSDVEHATALLRGELAMVRAETAAEFAAVRQEMGQLRVVMSDALARQTWRMVTIFGAFAAILSVSQMIFR